ncbi:hypothetical protein [Phytoactinopolyspora endophytica]|uniref:hypothetical protein n=1 Tax=Phytoactinopolyspora endophytica TaxID=1642495 RepID=UPI00101B8B0E|nr:hypothetical protein [Phytoactinopolyspora endophytica]
MDARMWAVSAALVVVLSACASGGEEPQGLETEPDTPTSAPASSESPSPRSESTSDEGGASTEPTAEDSPAQSPGPHVRVFDEAGVTVIMPEEIAGNAAAEALDVFTNYNVEWYWSLREVELSERIRGLAAQPRIDRLKGSLEYQRQNGITYGGEVTIEPYVEGASENVVAIGFCLDASELIIIDDDGERPADGVEELPRTIGTAELNRTEVGWQVTDEEISEEEVC